MAIHPKVLSAIETGAYRAKTKADRESIRRLAESEAALRAWHALDERVRDHGLSGIALDVVDIASSANLSPHERRTQKEIEDAGNKAAALAMELALLVRDNQSLRQCALDLFFEWERAARFRIFGGISLIGHSFQPDVEEKLDDLQRRDFPDVKPPTTSTAYRQLSYHADSPRVFAERLLLFAERAKKSGEGRPIVSYPRGENASKQVCALRLCGLFQYRLGSPCIEIATDFLSAIFDSESIDAETVKKWWQRRRDNPAAQ